MDPEIPDKKELEELAKQIEEGLKEVKEAFEELQDADDLYL